MYGELPATGGGAMLVFGLEEGNLVVITIGVAMLLATLYHFVRLRLGERKVRQTH